MKGHGKKCKKCKTYLEYEQIGGMRLKFEHDDKKYYYHTYCPVCQTYGDEKAPKD